MEMLPPKMAKERTSSAKQSATINCLFFRRRERSDNGPEHMIDGFGGFEYSGESRIKANHQLVLSNLTLEAVRLCFIIVERMLILHATFCTSIRFNGFGVLISMTLSPRWSSQQ
jgi:hypothetical protein